MRVALVHNAVDDESSPDDRDVLLQVDAVQRALRELDHEVRTIECSLDLAAVKTCLETIRPDIVFNLVESLGGQGRLQHLFPALLEVMRLPYTGSSALALQFTNHKILAKKAMTAAGLRTPAWIGPYPADPCRFLPAEPDRHPLSAGGLWIVKSLWEHASCGLEEDSLLESSNAGEVAGKLVYRAPALGGACFAEIYVDGREFNLALLAGEQGPVVLPPAEIVFEGYGPQKPRIVGYRAKWVEEAYEFHHTPRRFVFPPEDERLLVDLERAARRCWDLFGLGGYARVDFRVDGRGCAWILEVNTNPCISPDAGFAAALQQAGLPYSRAVARIVEDGLRRGAAANGGFAS
jgi:D-alanine-D-alanine ligase